MELVLGEGRRVRVQLPRSTQGAGPPSRVQAPDGTIMNRLGAAPPRLIGLVAAALVTVALGTAVVGMYARPSAPKGPLGAPPECDMPIRRDDASVRRPMPRVQRPQRDSTQPAALPLRDPPCEPVPAPSSSRSDPTLHN